MSQNDRFANRAAQVKPLYSKIVNGLDNHMAKAVVPHFHNDSGVAQISIGVKEFMCVGAKAPNDHPHVFLDMGDESEKVCPYCSTLYVYDADLAAEETAPEGCLLLDEEA